MTQTTPDQHVYEFAMLERVSAGAASFELTAKRLLPDLPVEEGRRSAAGAVLRGEHIVCTLVRQAQGTGSKARSRPNEQFVYILQGTMMGEFEGARAFAPPGTVLHTPGDLVHTRLACPDEDLVFLAIEDSRSASGDVPAGGESGEPACFAGFGSRLDEPRQTTSRAIEEARRLGRAPSRRYLYEMHSDADDGVGAASAIVTPDANLALPPGIRGKLLSGERLHVGVLRFDPGAVLNNYRRENEQFFFLVEGELEIELEGELMSAGRHCMLHVPAAIQHELCAPHGAVIVMAQDRRQNAQG